MTTVPHPEPTTRAEARANAVALLDEAQHLAMRANYAEVVSAAHVWSQIALTFPEEQPTIVVDNYSDFQRQMAADRPIGDPLHHPGGPELEPWTGDSGPEVEPIDDEAATQVLVLPHWEPVRVVLEGSGDLTHTDPPITVSAVAWDVLRLLAIRYVLSSINRGVTVDLTDEDTGPRLWNLEFARMPDSPIVHVTVSRTDDTVTG